MYTATITVSDTRIMELLAAEDKDFGRASYTIKKQGKKLILNITAQDASALKIAMMSITKALIVWEKTQEIQ